MSTDAPIRLEDEDITREWEEGVAGTTASADPQDADGTDTGGTDGDSTDGGSSDGDTTDGGSSDGDTTDGGSSDADMSDA